MTKKSSPSELSWRKSTARQTPGKEQPPSRRGGRTGNKSVSTLTTAQLERKRANDREAQRTIRQRTKEHIENLERQVAELNTKREQLDKALQRNAALETEIDLLRRQSAGARAGSGSGVGSGMIAASGAGPGSGSCPPTGYVNASTSPNISKSAVGSRKTTDPLVVVAANYSLTSRRSTSPIPAIHPDQTTVSTGLPAVNRGWSSYALTPSPSNESAFSSSGYGENNDSRFIIPTTAIDHNLYAPMMTYNGQRSNDYAPMRLLYPAQLHRTGAEQGEWESMV